MKNVILSIIFTLSLSALVAPASLSQPQVKDHPVIKEVFPADDSTDSKVKDLKHGSKQEAHDDPTDKADKTDKTDKSDNADSDLSKDTQDSDTTTKSPNANDNSSPAKVDNETDQTNDDSSVDEITDTSGSEKETVVTKSKHSKNGDSQVDSVNKIWETSLIKKQPSRKRSVTVEEVDDGYSLSGEGKIVLVLVLTLVALAAINMFSKRVFAMFMSGDENSEIRKRANTLSHMLGYFLIAITVALATVLVLKELGIDIGPILAGAGVCGVALGFGAQSIVRDFISGFYIFLEDQIRVGDVIQIADKSGYVEALTLRLVTLRDENGNVHYIPCGEIKMVTNMTKNFSRYVLKLALPYATDTDKVLDIVRNIDEELRQDPDFGEDILEPIEIMGVDQFENNAIVLKARTKTKPIKQWRVGREFNRRLKMRLEKEGIEMPYANVSLYMGGEKKEK